MFKETYNYEFEEDDCTVEKEITVGEKDIREALEYILDEKSEERINEVAKNLFEIEELAGLSLDEIKTKIVLQGEIDLITDWFWDDLYEYFKEIAEENGDVVSTYNNSDYVNDFNAGMAYYRANC